ncbi:SIRBL protein, partial [Rhinopomastus cyanomelas]|nr:SIRBL protein [Rhinopomastus cyanomelas]
QSFQLQQPQDKVSLLVGQTLSLTCTVSKDGSIGPVKWLKGLGSGNKTIYEDKGTFPRVMRVEKESNTDFSIRIRDVQPEDAGTYYCVKFNISTDGLKVFQHGKGTEVSVHASSLVPGMVAAAVVISFLLLLGLFIIICMYRRKHRGEVNSQCQARPVTAGSFLPILSPCCARTSSTPSVIVDAETKHLPSQQENNDIHYADLQTLPTAPWRSKSPDTACSEYATIKMATK